MTPPTTYGEIIFAARQAIDSDLPERDIVKLLRHAVGVTIRNPYKPAGEKKTADLPAYHRNRRLRLKLDGRCIDCTGENDTDGWHCTTCRSKRRERESAARAARRRREKLKLIRQ
jgi:hypothetical protein